MGLAFVKAFLNSLIQASQCLFDSGTFVIFYLKLKKPISDVAKVAY